MTSRKRNLKVLVVSQYRDVRTGGAERYAAEVCRRLAETHGMDLAYLSAEGSTTGELSPPCCSVFTASFHPAWLKEVPRLFAGFKPDVLLAHYTVPGLVDVAVREARKGGIPVCLMYHSDVTGAEWIKRLLGWAYFLLLGGRTLEACRILFVSSRSYAAASTFLRRIEGSFVEAAPGVDPAMVDGRAGHEGRFLLFVGKLEVGSKGFGVLRRAWAELRRTRPDLELVVVGGGRPAWAQAAEGLRLTGRLESRADLADWYASAAVTVLPSLESESFGMVLAESLVAGCPVVGSRIGGIPALVEEGVNGYLAEPGSVESLAAAIDKALRNRDRLRANIRCKREEYLERFSWDRTAAIIAESLRQSASGRKRGEEGGRGID